MSLNALIKKFVMTSMALYAATVLAVTPFKLEDIRIEGLQRVEPGTVLANLPFRVGDNYSDEKGALAIRRLFDLGLFNDVKIAVEGTTLKLVVQERPTIALVDFLGTVEFDKAALSKSLKDIGLSIGRRHGLHWTGASESKLPQHRSQRPCC